MFLKSVRPRSAEIHKPNGLTRGNPLRTVISDGIKIAELEWSNLIGTWPPKKNTNMDVIKKTVDIKEDRASEHVARKQNVQQIKPTGSKCTENRQRISTLGYVCCYY